MHELGLTRQPEGECEIRLARLNAVRPWGKWEAEHDEERNRRAVDNSAMVGGDTQCPFNESLGLRPFSPNGGRRWDPATVSWTPELRLRITEVGSEAETDIRPRTMLPAARAAR